MVLTYVTFGRMGYKITCIYFSPSTSQESGKVPSNSTSAGGKLKSKKFQQHLPGRRAAEEEDEEVVLILCKCMCCKF